MKNPVMGMPGLAIAAKKPNNKNEDTAKINTACLGAIIQIKQNSVYKLSSQPARDDKKSQLNDGILYTNDATNTY